MRLVLLLTALLTATSAFAGRVKIKGGVAILDGEKVLDWHGCDPRIIGRTCMVRSAQSGAPVFTLLQRYHDGYYNFDMGFVDIDLEIRIKVLNLKRFTTDLMDMGVLDGQGHVVPEAAERYARAYDTSGRTIIEIR